MKCVEDTSYLEQRGRVWWYNRRVPRRFARLDPRRRIKGSLGSASLGQARHKRDLLAEEDDRYWASLPIAGEAEPASSREAGEAVRRRYRMATVKALASGVTYQPIDHLATAAPIEEALARLPGVRHSAGPQEIPKVRDAEAPARRGAETHGDGVRSFPDLCQRNRLQRTALQIAKPAGRLGKTRRTSIRYFIDFAGDICLEDIIRELALDYQKQWAGQVKPKDPKAEAIAPNAANRHIGNIRSLYADYFRHVGEEERANPLRNMHFKAKTRTEVPPF